MVTERRCYPVADENDDTQVNTPTTVTITC